MKCSACGKEIYSGKLISCDGDFVCDDKCHNAFLREMDAVCSMSDSQFESWMMCGESVLPEMSKENSNDR